MMLALWANRMPSMTHEVLVSIFHEHPAVALELVRSALGRDLGAGLRPRTDAANFSDLFPSEYRADMVLCLEDARGTVEHVVIVEVQLREDDDKRYTWPVYVAGQRARYRCPVTLVVVCLNSRVAAWCAQPIDLGSGLSMWQPLVIGPKQIPIITDADRASAQPELALLSMMAHGRSQHGADVGRAAFAAATGLDEARATLYTDIIYAAANQVARKVLDELMMDLRNYEWQSPFARKYVGIGREEGRERGLREGRERGLREGHAESLLHILDAKGLTVSEALRQRILACQDMDTLDRWIRKAALATELAAIFDTE